MNPQSLIISRAIISQRIASKLGDIEAFGADPRRVAKAGHDVDGAEPIDFGTKYKNQNDAFKARFDSVGAKFNGKTLDDYVNGKSFCCGDKNLDEIEKNSTQTAENAKLEDNLYFYHPDHLGSTNLITNFDGEVTQSVAYIPYGEVFVEERNGSWATPFLFNAKELDEETGLYYYGARYLNPVDCRWLSTDPMFEKYVGMSPYNYCAGNPVKLVDPDGRATVIEGEESAVSATFEQLQKSTSLKLSISNGKLSATGKAKTEADKVLLNAINNEKVTVHLQATESKSLENGNWYVGGAFMGSKVDENNKVDAYQVVNPMMTEAIDEVMEHGSGVTMMHETLEAYIGGCDSPGSGMPKISDNLSSPSYKNYISAHNKAIMTDKRYMEPHMTTFPETGDVGISKFDIGDFTPKEWFKTITNIYMDKR